MYRKKHDRKITTPATINPLTSFCSIDIQNSMLIHVVYLRNRFDNNDVLDCALWQGVVLTAH